MNALNDCKSDDAPINYIYNHYNDGNNGNNDNGNNDNGNNDNGNDIAANPFDFSAIYDYYYTDHYNDYFQTQTYTMDDDECPALDLISTHYADFDSSIADVSLVTPVTTDTTVTTTTTITELNVKSDAANSNRNNENDDDSDHDYDEDLFELIQVESFHDFPLPK
jgi:hypothetical protein